MLFKGQLEPGQTLDKNTNAYTFPFSVTPTVGEATSAPLLEGVNQCT